MSEPKSKHITWHAHTISAEDRAGRNGPPSDDCGASRYVDGVAGDCGEINGSGRDDSGLIQPELVCHLNCQ